MIARLYTLLLAILPRRLQSKLWNHLANKHGYHGIERFGNGTMYTHGSRIGANDPLSDAIRAIGERKTLEAQEKSP